MKRNKCFFVPGLFFTILLAVIGCSDDDNNGSPTSPPPPSPYSGLFTIATVLDSSTCDPALTQQIEDLWGQLPSEMSVQISGSSVNFGGITGTWTSATKNAVGTGLNEKQCDTQTGLICVYMPYDVTYSDVDNFDGTLELVIEVMSNPMCRIYYSITGVRKT